MNMSRRSITRLFSNAKTDFGFREVPSDFKESLVKEVFSRVSSKYDIMNDLMSFGAHRLWKDELIRMIGFRAASRTQPNFIPRHIDVAGGTGDIAFRSAKELAKVYNIAAASVSPTCPETDRQVVVCDINPSMLHVGKSRAGDVLGEKVNMVGFVEGNAEQLPFQENSFDVYTIGFGLRNVTNKDKALAEAYRVLKPGGRLMVLEFSHVHEPMLKAIYDQYSFHIIPKIGKAVANDEASYQYLVESIRKFPDQDELAVMIQKEGFKCVSHTNFTCGVVAVHSGFKV